MNARKCAIMLLLSVTIASGCSSKPNIQGIYTEETTGQVITIDKAKVVVGIRAYDYKIEGRKLYIQWAPHAIYAYTVYDDGVIMGEDFVNHPRHGLHLPKYTRGIK